MKLKPADTWFSKCVRAANDWRCEKCKGQHEENSMSLHCSHILSRRHRTTRWCVLNVQALCISCHGWAGGNPNDFTDWIIAFIGANNLDNLRLQSNSLIKVSKKDEKDIATHYRKQLKEITRKRSSGETGYIKYISYQ